MGEGRNNRKRKYDRKKNGQPIVLNLSWFLFYGRILNMPRQEIIATRFSEMLDMITCLSIYNGNVEPDHSINDFDDAIQIE